MKLDWSSIIYDEHFVKALPYLVRFHLGGDLEPKSFPQGFDFLHEGRPILTLLHTKERIDSQLFRSLAISALQREASAALIVSIRSFPFRIGFAPRDNECWTPIVSWGRNQFGAIASLNRGKLQDILPYAKYTVRKGSTTYGSGSALWSDIIGFANKGVRIGEFLGVNPVQARSKLIRDVEKCWKQAGKSTRSCYVGTDGWFHFFKRSASTNAISFGTTAQTAIRAMNESPQYHQTALQVVMGANLVDNCTIVHKRGPEDDNSIIAYELITRFRDCDLRATDETVSKLVKSSENQNWVPLGSFRHSKHTVLALGDSRWR